MMTKQMFLYLARRLAGVVVLSPLALIYYIFSGLKTVFLGLALVTSHVISIMARAMLNFMDFLERFK